MIKKIKIFALFILLFSIYCQTSLVAQIPPDAKTVTFNAILGGALKLTVKDGGDQTAYFTTADDYALGVTEDQGSGIEPGYTTLTMEATQNWYLQINAGDLMPNGSGTGSIPITNVGVWCEASGIHQFGVEVTCVHTSIDVAYGLTSNDYTLINVETGNQNSGDENDNQFVLHWLMGTMNGSMNQETMFKQLSDGIFSLGTYITTINLTLTGVPE
jgi:hypothetical protein